MKNLIDYIYNINVIDSSLIYKDVYLLKTNDHSYLLIKVDNIKILDFVLNINNYVYSYYSLGFKLCYNIYNSYTYFYNNENYILFELPKSYKNNLDFIDMINFYNITKVFINNKISYKNNWDILWENKLNYLVKHVNNNKIIKKSLINLFWYYAGLCESAILYIRYIKRRENCYDFQNDICVVHRRIYYPNYKLNFYNPINYIIDLKVRDIAEYIKILFYKDQDYETDLKYFLKVEKPNYYNASLLFARIVYPSYFFDFYENNQKNIAFEKFYDTKSLEKFIKKTYEIINSYVQIKPIEWIINQPL